MTFELAEARQILEGTPASLRATLGGLSDAWLDADEGEGTWTPWQALAHMTHVEELDWIGRIETILEHGTDEVLGPVDREAGFDRYAGWPVGRVLGRFAEIRSTNLERLDAFAIADDDLRREGRHADFGIVTLGQLLATWAVHDLNHQSQIVKTLAKRYREAIGPWRTFANVVDLP
jgi:DinB superfamily